MAGREDDRYEEDRGGPRRREERDRDDRDDRGPRRRDDRDYDERDNRGSVFIPKNGMALAGYYLGFLAVVFALGGFALVMYIVRSGNFGMFQYLPLVVWGMMYGLGGICSLLAVLLSAISFGRTAERGGTGHAVTGLILGILTILGLIFILLLGMVNTR